MHNAVWGSRTRDRNGVMLEDFQDRHGLVVLNDGRPTWFQVNRAAKSCIDLTFTSAELALVGEWDIMDRYTMGSDHVPILSRFGRTLAKEQDNRPRRLRLRLLKGKVGRIQREDSDRGWKCK